MKLNPINKFFRRDALSGSLAARFASASLAIFGATVLVWALLPLAEGDTAERVLQARGVGDPSRTEIESVREEFALDRPLVHQYFAWLGRAARGDFSVSYQSGKPVAEEIFKRLPATTLLVFVALIFAIFSSVALALTSAAFHRKIPDRLIQFLTQAGAAMPSFLLGLLLLQFFVVGFGYGKIIATDSLNDVWLPAVCLAVGRAADWTQILRANLLEALNARFVLVARARGASRWRILFLYALPNALVPFLTVVGVGVGGLLGGAAIVETVFSWDGIGSFAVAAVAARDLPVVQGFVMTATLVFVASSLTVDLLSRIVDPRLRHAD